MGWTFLGFIMHVLPQLVPSYSVSGNSGTSIDSIIWDTWHTVHHINIFDFSAATFCYELKVSGLYNALLPHLGTQVIASQV
jgi:hypothetical protein